MPTESKAKSNETSIPVEHQDTEQHLAFTGTGKDNPEASDAVNKPENHITREQFEQRESGQADGSNIPPPDDAPRGL
jgi:hypothetical protein